MKNKIVDPIFIEGNLNSERYLELLQNEVADKVVEIVGEDQVWYHHDGCPAHNISAVEDYLNFTFPNKWIERDGAILWPPRSADLNSCDLFLWPTINNKVYILKEEIESLEELRLKIIDICNNIYSRPLAKVVKHFYDGLKFCLANNGDLFEQLI